MLYLRAFADEVEAGYCDVDDGDVRVDESDARIAAAAAGAVVLNGVEVDVMFEGVRIALPAPPRPVEI